ncbi:hypothetical protein A73_53 [Escherichia phage A73]|uniref:Uncharacterized protein n=2 Tax=Vequintavirinae TaxID=1911928 RepID=A0AAF0AQI7_9CAUD|nr:hypothetical protein A54_47 [Escherichia phage A5-4]WBF77637.1 hypothetical protein A73_53 [Escherichia phage A73]
MSQDKELAIAISVAASAHVDQVDKGGNIYILHPLQVMQTLQQKGREDLMAAGVLHDVIEDTEITMEHLFKKGISERTLVIVDAVTKKRKQSSSDYLEGILESEGACHVKLADLKHNLDILRTCSTTEKDLQRVRKYVTMHLLITEMVDWYESIGRYLDYCDSFAYSSYLDERKEFVQKLIKKWKEFK